MRKVGQETQDIDELIFQLTGQSPVSDGSASGNQWVYQWPVKVSNAGEILDGDTKPTLIGDYIPNKYINPSHPVGHVGLDLQAPKGTPIYPTGPGIVLNTDDNPKGGHTVLISHENGNLISYYAHCGALFVSAGQQVDFNDKIAEVSNTGNAAYTSPHCHWSCRTKSGGNIDPKSIIGKPIGYFSKQASEFIKIYKIANEFKLSTIKS